MESAILGGLEKTQMKSNIAYKAKSLIYGTAIGDALGVPFEFMGHNSFTCTGMVGNGTHHQIKGTWSDDTSLTLCLADQIAEGLSLEKLADKFVLWYKNAEYTATGKVFDVGGATSNAIHSYTTGVPPIKCGGTDERSNGNGSLMRISPLVFLCKDLDFESRFKLCKDVSSLTHAHDISVIACVLFMEFLICLYNGDEKLVAYKKMIERFDSLEKLVSQIELKKFACLKNILTAKESDIKSSGFVLHTLVASLYCFLHTNSYEESVLKAVNLGDDTDTTAAVTGAISGLYYGFDAIPTNYVDALQNKELLDSIIEKLAKKMEN